MNHDSEETIFNKRKLPFFQKPLTIAVDDDPYEEALTTTSRSTSSTSSIESGKQQLRSKPKIVVEEDEAASSGETENSRLEILIDSKIEEYITQIFSRNAIKGSLDTPIMVPNPENPREEITLGNLCLDIYNQLKTNGIYKFDTHFEIPDVNLNRYSPNQRKYAGVYSKNPNPIVRAQYSYTITNFNIYREIHDVIVKQVCLHDTDSIFVNDIINGFVSTLHEICLLYYAYILIENSRYSELVKVPRILCVELKKTTFQTGRSNDDYDCINIYMENIPNINTEIIPTVNIDFFKHWNPIINSVFQYFYENNLAHLDTKSNNIYFTGTPEELKLAIIDFGESILPETEQQLLRNAKMDGYYKNMTTLAQFQDWLKHNITNFNGTTYVDSTSITPNEFWGGIKKQKNKTKKNKNKKTKRRRTKKSYKNKNKNKK